MRRTERTQAVVDAFYKQHGPCCAGCDWWRWHNSLAGECIKTAPVSGATRFAMLGVTGSSLLLEAGHIMTPREHVCGEFQDGAPSAPGRDTVLPALKKAIFDTPDAHLASRDILIANIERALRTQSQQATAEKPEGK